jgi:hypothetical protein
MSELVAVLCCAVLCCAVLCCAVLGRDQDCGCIHQVPAEIALKIVSKIKVCLRPAAAGIRSWLLFVY